MVYEIILGRDEKDRKTYGTNGTLLLAKQYVQMGATTTLSQPVYLDVNRAHVIFVCGKRGSGKSYTLGVISEGIAKLPPQQKQKLAVIMFDTMGVYWTMKYPNHKDEQLLKEWGLQGEPTNITIYTPYGHYEQWKEQGIPTDKPFALNPSELTIQDWQLTFELTQTEPLSIFIEKTLLDLQEKKQNYTITDILEAIKNTQEEPHIKQAAYNRFAATQNWGLFSNESTKITELATPGQITILDLSAYATLPNGWRIKQLVLGIISLKLFIHRMNARKQEEYAAVHFAEHYILEEHPETPQDNTPLLWLMIDEAHEFLPLDGIVPSTESLKILLREGRQPGISLILATQQPGKIHTDAMTQSDIILAHRLTAKIDTDALAALLQSYQRTSLDKELGMLPRTPGSALAIDDVNEHIYPIRTRPRTSWHGGSAPTILTKEKENYTL